MTDRTGRVRALVASHEPADAAEAAHRTAILELLAGPDDPASRHRFEPGHLTASAFVVRPGAAGEGVADHGAPGHHAAEHGTAPLEVLMIHHERLGRWLQPGGHLEPEDLGPLEAAAREVAEETGLAVDLATGTLVDVDVHVIPAARREPAHLHFDLRFRFSGPEGSADAASPGPVVGDGVTDVAWMEVGALTRLGEAGLARVAEKLVAPG